MFFFAVYSLKANFIKKYNQLFYYFLLLEIKSMTGVGFEPTKLTHCRLKATPLTAREPSLFLLFAVFNEVYPTPSSLFGLSGIEPESKKIKAF